MKIKNLGKKIAIFYIILAIIVAVLVTTVLYKFITNGTNSNENDIYEQAKAKTEDYVIKGENILYQNAWGKDIVADIEKDVPIPTGFTYVEGTPENGLIIKEKGANNKLLWIPYDENADMGASDKYYKDIEVPEIDPDIYQSIIKYGGFYVNIGKNDGYIKLKDISQEEYEEAIEEAKEQYDGKRNVKPHLLSKEEIAQIINYSNKSSLETIKYSGETIQMYSVALSQWTNIDKYIEDNGNKTYYNYETIKGEKVFIPQGFEYCEDTSGYVRIADEDNEDLIYVWIPVRYEIEEIKDEIISKFNTLGIDKDIIDMPFIYSMIEEKMDTKAKASIETVGGFYMAEAELSYTNEEKDAYSTKARDMNKELTSAKKDEEGNVYSDYFRKSDIVEDGEDIKTFVEKAEELANKVQTQKSVTSHLAYGAEYDLARIWLINTEAATVSDIMKDSTKLGKYKGTYNAKEENTWKASKYQYLNGLWGLAGNLAELSQEKWEFKDGDVSGVVLRGGSYLTLGDIILNGIPVLGINTVQSTLLEGTEESENYIDSNSIGIRNCLYINVEDNAKDEEKKEETANYIKWDGSIADGFASGDGSIDDQYVIENPSQLAYLAQEVNNGNDFAEKYVQITNSFDMQNINWTPIGGFGTQVEENEPSELGAQFKGYLDGRGNIITNLKIDKTEEYRRNIGLIGYLGKDGQVSNINITNGDITGWLNVGGIVGRMEGEIIENCSFDGKLYCKYSSYFPGKSDESEDLLDGSGFNVGGIVGEQWSGTISKCENKGEVTAEFEQAGGIVGSTDEGKIEGCINKGKVLVKYDKDMMHDKNYEVNAGSMSGGIVGYFEGDSIKECENEGEIIAEQQDAGGIAGSMYGKLVNNCVNKGNIIVKYYEDIADESEEDYAVYAGAISGGIVGRLKGDGSIKECKNEGKIIAERQEAGGIVGRKTKDKGLVEDCKNTGEVEAPEYKGDIIGKEK